MVAGTCVEICSALELSVMKVVVAWNLRCSCGALEFLLMIAVVVVMVIWNLLRRLLWWLELVVGMALRLLC